MWLEAYSSSTLAGLELFTGMTLQSDDLPVMMLKVLQTSAVIGCLDCVDQQQSQTGLLPAAR